VDYQVKQWLAWRQEKGPGTVTPKAHTGFVEVSSEQMSDFYEFKTSRFRAG